MTRLLVVTLLIFMPLTADARMGVILLGGGVDEEAACGTIYSDSGNTSTAAFGGWTADFQYNAFGFVTGTTATMYSATVLLTDMAGSPTQVVTAAICTSSAGLPTETCVDADATYDSSGISGETQVSFAWDAGYALDGSTLYYFRMAASSWSASDYLGVKYNGTGTHWMARNDDPSTSWTGFDTDSEGWVIISSCVI